MLTSKRLQKIADLISKNDSVADIGADHGKLIIEVANKYRENKYFAVENKEGPFKNLQNSVEKFNFNKNIECSLSDGIENIPSYIDTLVFAGMGGENVISIISENVKNLKNIKKIIFSVHTDVLVLEYFLKIRGFFPSRIESVEEAGHKYLIFETIFDIRNAIDEEHLNNNLDDILNAHQNFIKKLIRDGKYEDYRKLCQNKYQFFKNKYLKSCLFTGYFYEN